MLDVIWILAAVSIATHDLKLCSSSEPGLSVFVTD